MDDTVGFPPPSPRHPKSPWTAERLACLRARWSQGVSAAQIACELGGGISRCAVLAKIHRLGIAAASPAAWGHRRRRVGAPRVGVAGAAATERGRKAASE